MDQMKLELGIEIKPPLSTLPVPSSSEGTGVKENPSWTPDQRRIVTIIETGAREMFAINELVCTRANLSRKLNSVLADLGADSLDIIEFVMYFEDELAAEIDDDDTEMLTRATVEDLINYLVKKAHPE